MSVPVAQRGPCASFDLNDNLATSSDDVRGGGGGGSVPAGGVSAAMLVFRPAAKNNPSSVKAVLAPTDSSVHGTGTRGQRPGEISVGVGGGGSRRGDAGQSGSRLSQHFINSGTTTTAAAAVVAAVGAAAVTPSVYHGDTMSMKPPATVPTTTTTTSTADKTGADRKAGGHYYYADSNITAAAVSPPPPRSTTSSPAVKLTTTPTSVTSDLTTNSPLSPMDSNAAKPDHVDDIASRSDNVDDDNVNNNVSRGESTTDSKSTPTTVATTVGGETGGGGGGGPIRNLRVRGQRKFLPEKTRHKRQTLQDMTRPLKQWLLRHKDNPYPSKAEKMDLVSKSQMTLTQVSNWFANARRRLKNTVKQPDLTWASRIKLYNSCVEGNAELFSICSDDSCPDSDDDMMEHRQSDTFHDDVTDSLTSSRTATPDVTVGSGEACGNFNHGSNSGSNSHSSNHSTASHHHPSYHHSHSSNSNSSSSSVPSTGNSAPHYSGLEDTCVGFHKYKNSILHRYLSDAHQQALILDEDSVAKSRDRHHSSSTGSRDFEELSTSSVSSPAHESVHHDHLDDFSEEFETMALRKRTSDLTSTGDEDMYWKEIGAAMALTSLARGRIVNT